MFFFILYYFFTLFIAPVRAYYEIMLYLCGKNHSLIRKESMKKILFLCLLCLCAVIVQAQTQKQKVTMTDVKAVPTTKAEKYAEIKFDTLRHSFGQFSKLDPIVRCSFGFTNTGTAPLIIHQAFASCGCTVPKFTKEPIKPGEKGHIEITYDGTGKFPGHFQKTITIRTNAVNSVVRLTVEGTME